MFLARYYPISKKINNKDRVNNFVALPGESVSSSWDRFTSFLRSVPNNHIDDESLREYFYRGQDDNNKTVLDMIAGGSYEECTYADIAKKLKKYPEIIKLGALGSRIQGEIILWCNLHTTLLQMRFVKRWLK